MSNINLTIYGHQSTRADLQKTVKNIKFAIKTIFGTRMLPVTEGRSYTESHLALWWRWWSWLSMMDYSLCLNSLLIAANESKVHLEMLPR